jgi:hypothetical protein
MSFFANLSQHPLMMVLFVLLAIYVSFWLFVSVAITVSARAREYFTSFFPQWFGRKGRPFTKREKIGACFQVITLGIILLIITL